MTTFDPTEFLESELNEHQEVLNRTRAMIHTPFKELLDITTKNLKKGGKILFFGNGGSAGDAQHLATELVVRYRDNRVPIPAIALTTDTSALTAIGNDLGFDHLFSRQIEALGNSGDIALGITTSGQSPNVIKGFEMAKRKGLFAPALQEKMAENLLACATRLSLFRPIPQPVSKKCTFLLDNFCAMLLKKILALKLKNHEKPARNHKNH